MPRGNREKYTDKQKSQVENIENNDQKRGLPDKEAEKSPWAPVNQQNFEGFGIIFTAKRPYGYHGV